MSRRLSWIAVLSAAFMFLATVPAAAVGPFGPAESLVTGGCTEGVGDAAIAVDGTTRGFANCTGFTSSGRIHFFRDRPNGAPLREVSPYIGLVYAVAWDGPDSTYVVFQIGNQLKIGKRVESSGAYSPLTTLTTGPAGNLLHRRCGRLQRPVVDGMERAGRSRHCVPPETSCSSGAPCSACRAGPGSPPRPRTSTTGSRRWPTAAAG